MNDAETGVAVALEDAPNSTWSGLPHLVAAPLDPDQVPAVAPLPPTLEAPRPIRAPAPPPSAWGAIAAVGVVVTWAFAIALGHRMDPHPSWWPTALFIHLVALIAGFGAVIALDWLGVLWLTGRRTLTEISRAAGALHPLIWGSLVLLTISGAALHPDLSSSLTRVKLAMVLVVALNGLLAVALERDLERSGPRPSAGLLLRVGATAAVSQLGWWTAMVIGYVHCK